MHFSIPEVSQLKDVNQGSYTVYHVHANGILHCKLRFKQFNSFHEQLKKQFGIYSLPYFPPKKLFPLKELQIEERRASLEKYMQIIGQDERIANSAPFNDFLLNAQQESLHAVRESIQLDVLLANNSRIQCKVLSTDNSSTIKETICRELKLPIKYTPFFALFVVKEVDDERPAGHRARETNSRLGHHHSDDQFINSSRQEKANCKYILIRKLMDFEAPCLSLQNANESSPTTTYRLKLIKFYWNTDLDDRLVENEIALNLIYIQAQADFERQSNELNRDHQQYLETLALRQSKKEYITFAKCVKSYGLIQFEQCVCDFPKPNTNCLISIKSNELTLRTLFHSNGRLSRNKEFILRITRIRCWRLTTGFDLRSPYGARKAPLLSPESEHKYELSIEYLISKDDLRWITIRSEQAVLMSTCLKSVIEELVLKKNNLPLYEEKSNEVSVNLRKNSANYYKSNDKSLANNSLVFGKSMMEKSLSVETFLVGPNKFTNNHGNQLKSRKVLVQNSAYDGIGDDDL